MLHKYSVNVVAPVLRYKRLRNSYIVLYQIQTQRKTTLHISVKGGTPLRYRRDVRLPRVTKDTKA